MTTLLSKLLRADRMRQDNDLAAKEGRDPIWSMRSIMEEMGFDWDEVGAEMERIATGEKIRYWAAGPGSAHIMAWAKQMSEFKDEEKSTAGKKYRVKCCGDTIQSMSRHDMVWCKCGNCGIDGGNAYTRIVGRIDDFEEVPASTEDSYAGDVR